VPLVYVNQFGGNDDLVFDGRSCGFKRPPAIRSLAPPPSTADVLLCDVRSHGFDRPGHRPLA